MKRIIFVDDEPNVLSGLRRMLRGMRSEWEMHFAGSGGEALEMMAQQPFDVIVSDIRMPEMDGVRLLTEVMQNHPRTVRIALSGHSDKETILRSVKPAHQYLSKPCEPEHLKLTVGRACALRDLMCDETITELVSQIDSLPSLPSLYLQIVDELQSEDCSIQKIGETISRDPAMAAKVLKLVNSAFFGLPRHVADPGHAVKLLGLETIKSLVLSIEVFSQYDAFPPEAIRIDALWRHSLNTAVVAKRITKAANLPPETVEYAFIGGLLHDIGKLILAVNMTENYITVVDYAKENQTEMYDAELNQLGVSHAEVGAYLLGLWGLPNAVIEAVGFHHSPLNCPNLNLSSLAAVHAANALCDASEQYAAERHINTEYLTAIEASDHLPEWQAIAIEQAEVEQMT
jgi:putative nucleotidyltransferase with HDIG domain